MIKKFLYFDLIFLCFDEHKILLNFCSYLFHSPFFHFYLKTNEQLIGKNFKILDSHPPIFTFASICLISSLNFLSQFFFLTLVQPGLNLVLYQMHIFKNRLAQKQNTVIYFTQLHHLSNMNSKSCSTLSKSCKAKNLQVKQI